MLISDDWKCLKFGFKVGGAPCRARKRETWSPSWRPWRGLRESNPFPLDRAPKVGYKHMNYNIVCALYPEIPGGGAQPILDKNSPTGIGLMVSGATLFGGIHIFSVGPTCLAKKRVPKLPFSFLCFYVFLLDISKVSIKI